tara:strand:+ start:272 stop:703 length:432 start_codon:yes stop_codon:yes gene_type:complete
MKKIAFLGIIISFLITPLSALEKQDCSGIKKLSKAFVACKSSNLKTGITNTGSKIKKNTIGKIKKPKKKKPKKLAVTEEKPVEIIKEVKAIEKKDCSQLKKISKAFVACKSSNLKTGLANKRIANKAFKGNTKKYPKYVKSKK